MTKLPTFATEKEAAKWFANHDTAPYMDELEQVKEKIPVRRTRSTKESVDLRLRSDQLAAIKRTAKRKGVSYQTLITNWLMEKLRQESPDLLRKHD